MRVFPIAVPAPLVLLALVLLVLEMLAPPAFAQVTVDLNALEQLKKSPGEVPAKHSRPPPHAKAIKPKPVKPKPAAPEAAKPEAAKPEAAKPAAPAPGLHTPLGFHAPLPPLPQAPPPNVVLTPVPPPVAPINKPAATPPVVPNAAGAGAAFPGGVRISFGSGQGEMSPASEQSLKALVAQAPKSETVSYNVMAYASGSAEDPSTARRLSLARGLAVRSVLMEAGVPSTRIYVRALGAPSANTPSGGITADRADVTVLGANAPPPDQAVAPPDPVPSPGPAATPDPLPGAAKTP